MDRPVTDHGLLRATLALALVLFGLFLGYHFLSGSVTATLMLLVGLHLAVALPGPVEVLHWRKIPRPIASVSIFVGIWVFLAAEGYLFLPVLTPNTTPPPGPMLTSIRAELWAAIIGTPSLA